MKINQRQLKKWIAALDSGKYKQSRHHLQTTFGYCCLGVACVVLIPKDKLTVRHDTNLLRGGFPGDQPHAPSWLKKVEGDFEKKTGYPITHFNDHQRYSFGEIATLLELVYIHKILD